MLRLLWTASLLLNLIAVIAGIRKAPLSWRIWATAYLIGNGTLRIFDAAEYPHANPAWCAVQILSTFLLANLVRYTVHPTRLFIDLSAAASIIAGAAIGISHKWPHSPVESVMFTTGIALLALGLMTALTALATFKNYTLAVYLLGSALLCLGGVEHADTASLGIATAGLDCLAFGAWAISFRLQYVK